MATRSLLHVLHSHAQHLWFTGGETPDGLLALDPIKTPPVDSDKVSSQEEEEEEEAVPITHSLQGSTRTKSAALIMNQNDRDFLVDIPGASLLPYENLGLHSPLYNFLESLANSNNAELMPSKTVEEYDAGDHGIGVNDTDCVVCNYGSSGNVNNYIPSNLPGQCVGLDQCGSTIHETISMADDSLASKGVEDKEFGSRLADRLASSNTFFGGGEGSALLSDSFKGLEGLLKASQPQVS